jgi:hypothetical protein
MRIIRRFYGRLSYIFSATQKLLRLAGQLEFVSIYYLWRKRFGEMEKSQLSTLKPLGRETAT